MKRFFVILALAYCSGLQISYAEPVRIGAESRVEDNERSHYNRYVNWRPANGETVSLNPLHPFSAWRNSKEWQFLTVIYPQPPHRQIPAIKALDDSSVQVGDDVISFDPSSPHAVNADFLIDTAAFRGLN